MIRFEISEELEKLLKKLSKKDRVRREAALKKIEEIVNCDNTNHYKNLRYKMKEFKRVRIDSHFVLIFRFDKKSGIIYFEALRHHDDIYGR